MKARKKDSNDEWKEIKYVQLEDSDILYKEEYMEFQHDTLSTELKTYEQIDEDRHWQDVRERAAIATLSGMLADRTLSGSFSKFAQDAVGFADALVEQLRKQKNGQ